MSLGTIKVIVCSDRASRGEYEDSAGVSVQGWLKERDFSCDAPIIIPDDAQEIGLALNASLSCSAVIFVGGTGLSPRDVTPQTLAQLCDYEIPGVGEYLRSESLKITPTALLSRCGAWAIQQTLVLALPGSRKASLEMMTMLADLLPRLIRGLTNTCKH